jgi:hypothetical protein
MSRGGFRWFVVLALAASGCETTGAGSAFGPRILSANERSVSVEILPIHNESHALRVADEHCKKFGRSAVLAQDRGRGKFNYECVK